MCNQFDFNTYRTAPRDSLEGWIYLAACHCKGPDEWIREVGRIAYTSNCCIWHAAWVVSGKRGQCECANCVRERTPQPAAKPARPVFHYKGRPCTCGQGHRTRKKVGWGFYNVVPVTYQDGQEPARENVPAGQFNKLAKRI